MGQETTNENSGQTQVGTITEVADAIRRDYLPTGENRRLGTTVLLTGAGCSRSAGVPLASEIAQALCIKLAVRYGLTSQTEDSCEAALKKLIDAGRLSESLVDGSKENWAAAYEEIFTKHYRTPKETRTVFSEILDGSNIRLNWAHLCIGELVRLGYISTVLTTNFDQLALEGIARAGRLPVVADGVESLNRITGNPSHPQLIQIHGSQHTYRLRNSTDDIEELAKEGGAIHAIDELMRAATVFLVAGYGGKERGLMRLLIDGAKRFPDTQIYWVAHGKSIDSLSPLTSELLATSRYSRVILDQDADHFFYSLLQEMGLNAPKIIEDPLFGVGNLKQSLAYSNSPEIEALIATHHQKVERIQSVFDPHAIGVAVAGPNKDLGIDEAKMQAVGRLASGVAHDFNNVLTATIGYSDLLLLKHPEGDPSHDDIIAIRESADRAAALVTKLLAFASSLKLKPQRLDLNKTILDLVPVLRRFVSEPVTIDYDLFPGLWPVYVDADEIENVVLNLVVNAGEAIAGAGHISVRTTNAFVDSKSNIKFMRSRAAVVVEVEDNGVGIDPKLGDRIFDPYFTTKPRPGSGMGLSAVFGIVKQSGGEVVYESEPGKGSIFRVYLPRHVQPVTTMDFAGLETVPDSLAFMERSRPLVVLYVEDERYVRDFTGKALRAFGFVVFEAGGGMEASQLYRTLTQDVDVVLSDIVMANGDGPSLLKDLRGRGYRGPFIMSSGYAEEDIRRAINNDLGTLFLPKPYSVTQLRDALAKVLSRPMVDGN